MLCQVVWSVNHGASEMASGGAGEHRGSHPYALE